jgi:uncharacterized membrane protein
MNEKHTFSISEALAYGWHTFFANIGFFVILLLVIFGINVAIGVISAVLKHGPVFFIGIIQLVSAIVSLVISLGIIKIMLAIIDGKTIEVSMLWSISVKQIISYLIASIMYGFLVIIGFILLIIPGIYFATKYAFISYVIVDEDLDPFTALKRSAELTQGNKMHVLGWAFAAVGVEILGLLALIIGLFVAIPVVMIANAFIYRQLSGAKQTVTTTTNPNITV